MNIIVTNSCAANPSDEASQHRAIQEHLLRIVAAPHVLDTPEPVTFMASNPSWIYHPSYRLPTMAPQVSSLYTV